MHNKNKKAALELSIGTIVIIVIAMTMLILGLVLVKNIFTGATANVKELDEKIKKEITQLFTEEEADIVVRLGSEQTARIKQGTDSFNIPIGARTLDGSNTDRNRLKYKLTLDDETANNCLKTLGKKQTETLFKTRLDTFNSFDKFEGSNVFALIELTIPKGTQTCTQKVLVDVTDTQTNVDVGGNFFKIDITKSGIF